MIRPELHKQAHAVAAQAPLARPRLDAMSWKAAQDAEARTTEAVAVLLQKLEEAAAQTAGTLQARSERAA